MNRQTVSPIMLTLLLTSMLTLTFNVQRVKTQADGDPLFFDDFDDSVADGWTVQLGNFEVVDGEYYTENDLGEKSITTVDDLTLTDCIIETNLRFSNTETGFRSGIVFRYTDNAHHYVLYVSAEADNAEFCMFTPGDTHWGATIDNQINYSVVIDYNTDYLLRVSIQGDTFTGFLNGEKILLVTDGNYTSGQVGLRGQRSDIYFDNFTVYSGSGTIYVDDDNTSGPWDGTKTHPYQNITSGIEQASAGYTIFVYNGTYYEHVVVDKTLTLTGENKDTTIIDAGGTEPGSIVVVVADNVEISNFAVQHSRLGGNAIWIDGYVNNTISDNIIANNGDGIRILHSSGNLIAGNIVKNNPYTAVGFDWAHDNIVNGNTITRNYIGVGAGNPSYDNTFSGNTISSNNYGFLVAMYDSEFYHNNIIGNTVQAAFYGAYVNAWDDGYPSGGNYWSDYSGVDSYGGPYQNETGSDGIGDTPYVVDENNQDSYPLMEPWIPPATLSVKPPSVIEPALRPGSSFQVDVYGYDLVDIYSWQVWMEWTQDVLNCTTVGFGDFLADQPEGSTQAYNIQNDFPFVAVGEVTNGANPGKDAEVGLLCTITFEVEILGETVLDISGYKAGPPEMYLTFYTSFSDYPDRHVPIRENGFFSNIDAGRPGDAGRPTVPGPWYERDGLIDIWDLTYVGWNYGYFWFQTPETIIQEDGQYGEWDVATDVGYREFLDINEDGVIDLTDLSTVAINL